VVVITTRPIKTSNSTPFDHVLRTQAVVIAVGTFSEGTLI